MQRESGEQVGRQWVPSPRPGNGPTIGPVAGGGCGVAAVFLSGRCGTARHAWVPKRASECQNAIASSQAAAEGVHETAGARSIHAGHLSRTAGPSRAHKPFHARRSPRLVDLGTAVSAKRSSRLPRLLPATSPLT